MDADAKKAALRMIPYGLYVLTGESKDGHVAAATVNWVTQASFAPPLVAVGVKADSSAHAIVKSAGAFALNVLAKGQNGMAFTFFKSLERDGDTIGGEKFSPERRARRSSPWPQRSSSARSSRPWRRAIIRCSSAKSSRRVSQCRSRGDRTTALSG